MGVSVVQGLQVWKTMLKSSISFNIVQQSCIQQCTVFNPFDRRLRLTAAFSYLWQCYWQVNCPIDRPCSYHSLECFDYGIHGYYQFKVKEISLVLQTAIFGAKKMRSRANKRDVFRHMIDLVLSGKYEFFSCKVDQGLSILLYISFIIMCRTTKGVVYFRVVWIRAQVVKLGMITGSYNIAQICIPLQVPAVLSPRIPPTEYTHPPSSGISSIALLTVSNILNVHILFVSGRLYHTFKAKKMTSRVNNYISHMLSLTWYCIFLFWICMWSTLIAVLYGQLPRPVLILTTYHPKIALSCPAYTEVRIFLFDLILVIG